MKSVETSEKKNEPTEAMLTDTKNRILDLQHVIAEMMEQLDISRQNAAKQSYPGGEVVPVEKLDGELTPVPSLYANDFSLVCGYTKRGVFDFQ